MTKIDKEVTTVMTLVRSARTSGRLTANEKIEFLHQLELTLGDYATNEWPLLIEERDKESRALNG